MDRWVAAGGVALGVGYGGLVLRMPVGDVEDPVGPRMFPLLIAAGIVLAGIFMLVEAWARPVVQTAAASAEQPGLRRSQAIGVAGVAIGALLFMALMEPLGFLPVAFLLMLGMLTAFNRGQHLLNLAVAAGVALVLYVGLKRFLGVALPSGILDWFG